MRHFANKDHPGAYYRAAHLSEFADILGEVPELVSFAAGLVGHYHSNSLATLGAPGFSYATKNVATIATTCLAIRISACPMSRYHGREENGWNDDKTTEVDYADSGARLVIRHLEQNKGQPDENCKHVTAFEKANHGMDEPM